MRHSLNHIIDAMYRDLKYQCLSHLGEVYDGHVFVEGSVNLRTIAAHIRELMAVAPCDHNDYGWRVTAGEGDGQHVTAYSCEKCLPATVGWAQWHTNAQAEVIQSESDPRFPAQGDE